MPPPLPSERITNQTTFNHFSDQSAWLIPYLSSGLLSIQFQAHLFSSWRQSILAITLFVGIAVLHLWMTYRIEAKWPQFWCPHLTSTYNHQLVFSYWRASVIRWFSVEPVSKISSTHSWRMIASLLVSSCQVLSTKSLGDAAVHHFGWLWYLGH